MHRVADDVVAAAVELAGRAAAAPRELIVATKATMRLTAGAVSHTDAVEIEVRAQAESVRSEQFRQRLAELQAKIRGPR